MDAISRPAVSASSAVLGESRLPHRTSAYFFVASLKCTAAADASSAVIGPTHQLRTYSSHLIGERLIVQLLGLAAACQVTSL